MIVSGVYPASSEIEASKNIRVNERRGRIPRPTKGVDSAKSKAQIVIELSCDGDTASTTETQRLHRGFSFLLCAASVFSVSLW